ncbi:hypothetical protein [Photobacterium piscicola]|uniref:DUF11 domain-containing protein n=1 Tax=Photobacterium piscicola TaxID=1378299 RepID=A0A1T5HUZ7_9GAMM|nr:hypothetical protein [Photobacterium piscicola]MEC6823163.1 DUF11 domain-containing protein [Photobacterium piscicola]MEC6882867.1 DUF11 domain-containing protein [Photobacterium piscicola]MEC6900382.1 DUF11 domain-containing protein [Photobacterium piscicola]SKC30533.1 hypothetical protein CZ809_00005 [Photobacterium piscicola]
MLKYLRDFSVFFILNITSYTVLASISHDVVLTKTVTNITQQSEASTLIDAKPGDVIEYNIYVANSTYSAISNINISASVPHFTTLATAIDCNDGNLPSALSCQISTPDGVNDYGYQGGIIWQLSGKLEAGVTAHVSYQVTIK